jgi:hypothetical protein
MWVTIAPREQIIIGSILQYADLQRALGDDYQGIDTCALRPRIKLAV